MMENRLAVSRELMSEDSAIFVNIDDREVARLRLAADGVFGKENFIANIVWQKKQSPQSDAINLSDMHDHILVYARRAKSSREDPRGWQRRLLPRDPSQEQRYRNLDEEYMRDNRVWWGESGTNFPRIKRFRSEVAEGVVPSTWWSREEAGDNQEARREMRHLFSGEAVYSTPKPTRLVQRIGFLAANSESLICDFFAGSGTTAHAVINLNRDLAETLSCVTGKWIRRIHPDPADPSRAGAVEFEDGTTVDLNNPPWELVKPLIWW